MRRPSAGPRCRSRSTNCRQDKRRADGRAGRRSFDGRSQRHDAARRRPLAPGVEDASLHVLPDGPHKTKLDYKPGVAQDVAVQIRGNPANPGRSCRGASWRCCRRRRRDRSRRAAAGCELAQALVNEGAPLAARVIVNRVWKHHFGAAWSRRPATSAPGRPADAPRAARRPGRPLHRRRLVAEVAAPRDRAVGGLSAGRARRRRASRRRSRQSAAVADESPPAGGRGLARRHAGGHRHARPPASAARRWTWATQNNRRRTLYGTVKRRELNDLLRLHDFPDPTTHSAGRDADDDAAAAAVRAEQPVHAAAGRGAGPAAEGGGGRTEARVRRAYRLLLAARRPRDSSGWRQRPGDGAGTRRGRGAQGCWGATSLFVD